MKQNKKRSLSKKIIWITVFPVIVVGLISALYSGYRDVRYQTDILWRNLAQTAEALESTFRANRDRWINADQDAVLAEEIETYVALIADTANLDVTLFLGDVRVATTIKSKNGNLATGTKASPEVVKIVLEDGRSYSTTHQAIEGVPYYAYYIPLRNENGAIVGMAFAGNEAFATNIGIWASASPILFIVLILTAIFAVISYRFSRDLVISLQKMMDFMSKVAKGELLQEIDEQVLKRQDEITELGEYAVKMSSELEKLTWSDPLTGLYNRRAGMRKLSKLIASANSLTATSDMVCSVAMADIDFFKKVNDTYGHAYGDEVLKKVSEIIRKHLEKVGFASRWGGEEFLLAASVDRQTMKDIMQKICDEVRAWEFECNRIAFHVTMTVGLTQYRVPERLETCVENADRLLYYGKEAGRDRIVSE